VVVRQQLVKRALPKLDLIPYHVRMRFGPIRAVATLRPACPAPSPPNQQANPGPSFVLRLPLRSMVRKIEPKGPKRSFWFFERFTAFVQRHAAQVARRDASCPSSARRHHPQNLPLTRRRCRLPCAAIRTPFPAVPARSMPYRSLELRCSWRRAAGGCDLFSGSRLQSVGAANAADGVGWTCSGFTCPLTTPA